MCHWGHGCGLWLRMELVMGQVGSFIGNCGLPAPQTPTFHNFSSEFSFFIMWRLTLMRGPCLDHYGIWCYDVGYFSRSCGWCACGMFACCFSLTHDELITRLRSGWRRGVSPEIELQLVTVDSTIPTANILILHSLWLGCKTFTHVPVPFFIPFYYVITVKSMILCIISFIVLVCGKKSWSHTTVGTVIAMEYSISIGLVYWCERRVVQVRRPVFRPLYPTICRRLHHVKQLVTLTWGWGCNRAEVCKCGRLRRQRKKPP